MTEDEQIAIYVRLQTAVAALKAAYAIAQKIEGAPTISMRDALLTLLGCEAALKPLGKGEP